MSKRSTVIVTNANKPKAQKVISDLHSKVASEGEDAYVSEAGLGFFEIGLKKGIRKYWASSGAFHTTELSALINSGLTYNVTLGSEFSLVLEQLELSEVVIQEFNEE